MSFSDLSSATVVTRTNQSNIQFVNYTSEGTYGTVYITDGANKIAEFQIELDSGSNVFHFETLERSTPINPKRCTIFSERLIVAGQSDADSTVAYSTRLKPYDFTGASAGTIDTGDVIVGIKVFRNSLVIFCKNSIYELTNLDSTPILKSVTKNIGCVDGNTIQEIGGDLVFLAPDGLRTIAATERIDDTELGTVSKQIQTRINEITTHNINSLVIRSKSQYRLFFPTGTSQAEDSSRGLLSVIKANPNTGSLGFEYADIKGLKVSSCDSEFISGAETIVSGGYDGYVYKQESGNVFTQASANKNISSIYRSPDMTMGDPGIRKNMQKVIWNINPTGTLSSSFLLEYDFSDDEVPQPEPYTLSQTGNIAQYGLTESTYGTAVYGSTGSNLIRQAVEGSGFTIAAKILDATNNSPVALKGFEMEFSAGGRR